MYKLLKLLLFPILFSLLTNHGKAQGIFYSSKDLDKTVLDSSVRDVRTNPFSNKILVIYKNKTRKRIPLSSIWGFENRSGQRLRRWKGNYALIRNTGIFSTYLVKQGRYSAFYFSRGPDGDLYGLSKRDLHKIFGDNQCFMGKVDSYCNFFHSCQDFHFKTKRLRVEEFYSECQ